MALPLVVIVGRPNVGKSSLFNMLVGKRTSIVEPTPGVTRDRVSAIVDIGDACMELVDTGGIGAVDRDDLGERVERQIQYALDRAALVLLVVDVREGLTPLDRQAAELLRRRTERVRLLANKVDDPRLAGAAGEFSRLGFGEALPVSAASGLGRHDLDALIEQHVSRQAGERPPDPVLKLAIVGKRNAGKSSVVNALAQEERVIVSEVPGTTRDSIDVRIEKDGRTLVAIDTAGVRKKNRLETDVEFYAYTRATRAIERADVVLFLIDSTVSVGRVDKRLGSLIAAEYKPCVLVVNKWDLARGKASTGQYGEYLARVLPELDYAPVSFTSAKSGRNVSSTVDLATELFKQAQMRVGTGRLNQVLRAAVDGHRPRGKRGQKAPRFFYAAQVATSPPTIVVFVNAVKSVSPAHGQFLLNRFREALPFSEIPIRLVFRCRRGAGPRVDGPRPVRPQATHRSGSE